MGVTVTWVGDLKRPKNPMAGSDDLVLCFGVDPALGCSSCLGLGCGVEFHVLRA